jgi:hypothetical protein
MGHSGAGVGRSSYQVVQTGNVYGSLIEALCRIATILQNFHSKKQIDLSRSLIIIYNETLYPI